MVNIIVILSILFSVGELVQIQSLNSEDSHFGVDLHEREDVGKPLYLTPLLEEGNVRKARQMSRVKIPKLKGVRSFSGYFTVNKECESNLFFWFFPAQDNWRNASVVLWLQGGPGSSSLLGLFEEMGPLYFNKTLEKRPYSWNVKNNLLFIDQPVGTGFSFTRRGCYPKNGTEVSRDLYSALIQFYQLFPFLLKTKFYITGQSFAGHFIPAVAYAIHKNNPSAKYKIRLNGLMIGNGLMDVMYQSDYSSYLYQLGLVDDRQRDTLKEIEKEVVKHLNKTDLETGSIKWSFHFRKFRYFTIKVSYYNYLKKYEVTSRTLPDPWEEFVTSPKFQKSLHVGNTKFWRTSDTVYLQLKHYVVQSVKYEVEELLEHYPVVFYHGQLDIMCAYPMAVNFFRNLQWSGARDYLQAERQEWCVQDQQAGYFKSAHNLHEVLVRAAGHMVPQDQPLWAFELMNSVTSSPADNPLQKLRVCS